MKGSVLKFLEDHKVGRLGTADASAKPHVVPICYAATESRIYSVIDEKPKSVAQEKLKRIRNIRGNPQVCLTVDEYSDDWSRLGFVMVHGAASIIYAGSEHQSAAELLRGRYRQYSAMDMTNRPILAITPERIVTWGKV